MAWTDSTNATKVFIETPPDWSREVTVIQEHKTDILTAFSGAEQRARRRNYPLYEIAYETEELSISFAELRAQFISEIQAPLVIPIWTRAEDLVSLVTRVMTLGNDVTKAPFKVGDHVYVVEDGETSCFLEIEAVSGSTVTHVTGNAAYPNVSVPSYTSAAIVYPCIVGFRQENTFDFTPTRVENTRIGYHVREA